MSITNLIKRNFVTVTLNILIQDAIALISSHQQLLVVAQEKLVGIVTSRDIINALAQGVDFASTSIAAIMRSPVITVTEEQCHDYQLIWSVMQTNSVKYLPVLGKNQEILGIICDRDLWQVEEKPQTELERFFELNPSLLCIAGFDGYFKRINPAFSDFLGFTPEELFAEPFINFVHPDDRSATMTEVASLQQGNTTLSFENRYLTQNGDYRWLLWTAKPYLTESLIYAAARDITERKEAELALQESEERWQLALKGANDGIWDWNVKTNEVFFSRRWKEMLGFTETEISNNLEEWSKRVHPDDLNWVMAVIQEHFAHKTPFYISEHRVLCKDGSYKWILDRGQALWDEAGNVIRMTGSHTDISDRRKAELQLQRERDFSNAIINTVGALITVLDCQGKIVNFNHTCEQITGYTFAEIQGQVFWDVLITPEEKSTVQNIFQKLIAGEVPHQYTNYWLAKDGTRHLISWSNTTLFNEQNQVNYIIATGIDITQQHQVWNQLEQQYRQTKLLADITRKIRMSIDITEILQTTVTEVQNLLNCDRVLIVEIHANYTAIPISEAILPNLTPMLGYELVDPLLTGKYLEQYQQGEILAINDLDQADIAEEVKQLLREFQIKAKLVVPILFQKEIQGLLVAHQCRHQRNWQPNEINLLIQLADQIGVALSQAQLLDNLELMVEERTIELTTTNELLKAEIAEREQKEADLRENQQKLRGILDNADEAIISINEQQQIQLFNRGAEKIFGYQASEIIGQSLELLIPNSCRQKHRQYVNQFHQLAQQSRIMAQRNNNVSGLRKDGTEFPAEASIAQLKTRTGMLFTVMLKDITERKQAEEKLRLITDGLPVLIAYIDRKQRHLYINQTYETWFGKSRSTILGLEIKDLFTEAEYQAMLPYITTVLAGKPVMFEIQSTRNNQTPFWMSATYIPDFDSNNQVKGFFSMVDNITERKEIEKIKSEFVSIASHEMRTPLTSIYGVIKLLNAGLLGKLSPRGQEMVAMALRNSDRLINLVNDILDLERMESGEDSLELQACNSKELIQQAIDTVKVMAQKSQITLHNYAISTALVADRDRLVQTLTNLLSNAIKFSPKKSHVKISCQLKENQLFFAIQDQGKGIPQDKLKIIFERFQQVDASDSRKKGGTGLGLAICRHIVEQHGGKIWAESIYGQGSTFYLTIPLKTNQNSPKKLQTIK